MTQDEKRQLLSALKARVKRECAAAIEAQQQTQAGMTHEESRPENDKDTRAIESSYLARGQAARVVALRAEVVALEALQLRRFGEEDPVAVGAYVELEDAHGTTTGYFLAPAGAGEQLHVSSASVQVITPSSPLGRALLGARVDDDIELDSPTGRHRLTLVGIA